MNVKRLTALFLSCFGTSYHEYINSLRLNDAIVLLEQTQHSIFEIAEKTGFGSVRSFQRQFLDRYNMSPNDDSPAVLMGWRRVLLGAKVQPFFHTAKTFCK